MKDNCIQSRKDSKSEEQQKEEKNGIFTIHAVVLGLVEIKNPFSA